MDFCQKITAKNNFLIFKNYKNKKKKKKFFADPPPYNLKKKKNKNIKNIKVY